MPEVVVASDGEVVSELAADLIAKLVKARGEGPIHIALSGGSTPRLLYERLGAEPYVSEIPWDRVHLWWSDERAVGPEDPQSNYRLARESLIDSVPVPKENVHRIRAELGAQEAATLYSRELQEVLGKHPVFDVVLLGVGPDGHTASIFADYLEVIPPEQYVTTTSGGLPDVERVTFTFKLINSARDVVMLAVGETKATVIERVLMGDGSLPAARVKPEAGESHLHLFLDRQAAADLDRLGV